MQANPHKIGVNIENINGERALETQVSYNKAILLQTFSIEYKCNGVKITSYNTQHTIPLYRKLYCRPSTPTQTNTT